MPRFVTYQNAWELRALPRRPCCELCGEEIGAGEPYYELPDGLRICAESDCLADWASAYRQRAPEEGAYEG